MTTPSMPPNEPSNQASDQLSAPIAPLPRDDAYWAQSVERLHVSALPAGVSSLNVDGRRVVGPLQGFGQMWRKTYGVGLVGAEVTPVEVIKTWKEQFPRFWPKGNRFYAPLTGIAPGEVAALQLKVGGAVPLSTGVLVLYADDESFTLMTPQGHVFAGWITFSGHVKDECTLAQAQLLIRANDPLYELGMRLGGSREEDRFWMRTLAAVAAHFGVQEPVQRQVVCVDPRLQWSQAGNIWQNAAIRTTIHTMTTPIRRIRRWGERG
jgi:hypothetical protein